ncbi:MAG: hypothetical protein HKL80_02990 [Acidimicrobiales bacterium]|nr:hypothetical protein [Acidimicrobiales bacterium]
MTTILIKNTGDIFLPPTSSALVTTVTNPQDSSNRTEMFVKSTNFAKHLFFIDKIRYRIPLNANPEKQINNFEAKLRSRWGSGVYKIGSYSSVYLRLNRAGNSDQGFDFITIEYNPNKITASPVHEVDKVIEQAKALLVALGNDLGEELSFDQAVITRLDITVDFHGIESPSEIIEGLLGIYPKYSRFKKFYLSLDRREFETLVAGTKITRLTIYNKYEQTKSEKYRGTLRWEVVLKKDALDSNGFNLLSDLTQEQLDIGGLKLWEWSQAGRRIVRTRNYLWEQINLLEASKNDKLKYFAYLILTCSDMTFGETSVAMRRKFSNYNKELGISCSSELISRNNIKSVYLDITSGCLVEVN